jgi:hypothetical protein
MLIGKVVKSASHVRYQARIFHSSQVDCPPGPGNYALGTFVRITLLCGQQELVPLLGICPEAARRWATPTVYAVGVICDTILLTPEPDTSGLYLSNEAQRELFSPDFAEERGVLVWIHLIGMMVVQSAQNGSADGEVLYSSHGVPLLAAQPHSEVARMADAQVRAFHLRRDARTGAISGNMAPFLGYYGQLAAPGNFLLPQVRLMILDYLEQLFPDHVTLLRMLKHMSGWQRLVEAMG